MGICDEREIKRLMSRQHLVRRHRELHAALRKTDGLGVGLHAEPALRQIRPIGAGQSGKKLIDY